MRIACVIVTFNRLGYLKGAFQAVSNQSSSLDFIIIVDNNSTDGSVLWLSELAQTRNDVTVLLMDRNYGGAGGFHYGIKKAYESGADWIWTMDDDCLPDPDALEKLVDCGIIGSQEAAHEVGFLASRVNWKNGSRHKMNVPGSARDLTFGHDRSPGCTRIRYGSFVSILINRNAVEQVGFPIKEFFINFDDLEFTRRITSAGFSGFHVESSKVSHLTLANVGLTLDQIVANPAELELRKRQYAIRNLVAVNKHERYGLFKETVRLIYILAKLIINRTPPRTQVALMWAGVRGLCLDYHKWIKYPSLNRKQ